MSDIEFIGPIIFSGSGPGRPFMIQAAGGITSTLTFIPTGEGAGGPNVNAVYSFQSTGTGTLRMDLAEDDAIIRMGATPVAVITLASGVVTYAAGAFGAITAPFNITGQSATAFTVALAGSNYALQVDTNTAASITGIKITAAATGNGVAVAALGGTNETITFSAKGAGVFVFSTPAAPASVGTTPGTAAGTAITSVGGVGGATSIVTTGTGGTGGGFAFTGGAGGTAALAATAGTGGNGGAYGVITGAGAASAVTGSGTGTGGNGGAVSFLTGDGGAVTVSTGNKLGGTSGAFSVTTGAGGASSAGAGTDTGGPSGAITFTTGTGGNGTEAGGSSGAISLQTGAAGTGGTGVAGTIDFKIGGNVLWGQFLTTGIFQLGVAGSRLGKLNIAGNTSGVVTVTTAAAAGTWTLTLPDAVAGMAGYQLTDAGANGISSWAAAASKRDLKDVGARMTPQDGLDALLALPVHKFHYKSGMGTGDTKTEYVGIMADEAPHLMHYGGGVINPVNGLGYTILAIQALETKIETLESELASLRS